MINIIVAVISFLGLFIGALIAKFTKEELEAGEKYFVMLRKLLLFVAGLVMFYFTEPDIMYVLAGLIIGYVIDRPYLYFGSLLAFAGEEALLWLSGLIFIYGLSDGTLKSGKGFKKYLIIAALIFFIPFTVFTVKYYEGIVSLASGALLMISMKK